jgi:4-hydroxybenzoate polyprenyltransferase
MAASEQTVQPNRTFARRLYGFLALARISNSPTVVSNALAGAALAGVVQPDIRIIAVAFAMVLFYTAGMFLNDVCDYAIDCRTRPERPLPSGLVSRAEALAVIVGLFLAGSGLLWWVEAAPFVSGLVLIGLIIFYDLWHKTNPLSPVVMAANRGMVYVTASLAVAPVFTPQLAIGAGLLMAYVVGLTYIAKCENRPAFKNYWPTALVFLPLVYLAVQPSLAGALLAALFAAWAAYSVSFVYRSQRAIGRAITGLIAGISLYDGLVLASAGSFVGALLALAAFGLTLFFQRYIKGT